MHLKEKMYSMDLSELGIPRPDAVPVVVDSHLDMMMVVQNYQESLNFGKALSNYLIQRNRTYDMEQTFKAGRKMLDARNEAFRQEAAEEIKAYAAKLSALLAKREAELEIETQRIKLKNEEIAEIVTYNRAAHQGKLQLVIQFTELHLGCMRDIQSYLNEIEKSSISFIQNNRHYYNLREHCERTMRILNNRLKSIVN